MHRPRDLAVPLFHVVSTSSVCGVVLILQEGTEAQRGMDG